GREIGGARHHLSRRAHLGAEDRVGTREAGERKHRSFHRDVPEGLCLEEVELGETCAGHDAARRLDEVHTGRLRGKRDRAGGARVRLEHIDALVDDRELHVHEPDYPERMREPAYDVTDRSVLRRAEGRRGQHARRVPGVHARLFDVLHDRADVRLGSVGDGVDVDLDRAFDEAVDQDGAVDRAEVVHRVADAHRPPAEHVRRANQDRKTDPLCDRTRLVAASRYPPLRTANPEPVEQGAEALAILGYVHRLERRPDDAVPGRLEPTRQLQRGLTAELDRDAVRPLPLAHREHFLQPERLEVQPVRGVVVRGHRLRVAVDHHCFVAEGAKALRGVHAAVVELDSLTDAVRAGAEDDDAWFLAARRRLVGLAPGRVVIRRGGLDLTGTRVDPTVRGT